MKFLFSIFILFTANIFAQTQVVIEETMFMYAPYIGEVITKTTKYAADGLFREESIIDVDRFLIRMAMGGNKTVGYILDGQNEARTVYNVKDEEYAQETFGIIRENEGKPTLKGMSAGSNIDGRSKKEDDNSIDAESEKDNNNDKEDKIERTISDKMETINGFKVRKVTTKIHGDKGMVFIEEWLTTDTMVFRYAMDVESALVESYGGKKLNVPQSFSESMLPESDHEYESVPGRMVKYTMEMKDDNKGFKMVWELKSAKNVPFNRADFEIPTDYDKVNKLD